MTNKVNIFRWLRLEKISPYFYRDFSENLTVLEGSKKELAGGRKNLDKLVIFASWIILRAAPSP